MGVKQQPWTPTVRRGMIAAEMKSPAPNSVDLPPLLGMFSILWHLTTCSAKFLCQFFDIVVYARLFRFFFFACFQVYGQAQALILKRMCVKFNSNFTASLCRFCRHFSRQTSRSKLRIILICVWAS